ncbi:MAG: glucosaminidase domain-containing protein [Treponema sp.]|nr:glucosaminidase domain-containing protein [Treponema sp.]
MKLEEDIIPVPEAEFAAASEESVFSPPDAEFVIDAEDFSTFEEPHYITEDAPHITQIQSLPPENEQSHAQEQQPAPVEAALPVPEDTQQIVQEQTTPEQLAQELVVPEQTPTEVLALPFTELPQRPSIPENILGQGLIDAEILSEFLSFYHPEMYYFSIELSNLYAEEAAIEGVNHDVAFAQMCLETGFLRFGGLVLREMNNFCGLGALGQSQRGEWFPDPRTGVRAHIQHLKAYATEEPLNQDLVDPRYNLVRLGSAPKIGGLAGTWAVDLQYGQKINSILERLYEFSFQRNVALVYEGAQ